MFLKFHFNILIRYLNFKIQNINNSLISMFNIYIYTLYV